MIVSPVSSIASAAPEEVENSNRQRDDVSRGTTMSQGYFLAIAGNIGVGKTELTNRLSAELGWLAYYEPVIDNPYLDVFYADMRRWSFHLQIYFLSERFKAQAEIGKSQLPFIQDRTIYEDAEIFAKTLHARGAMTEVDYQNYSSLFHVMVGYLRKPDLVIYLKASPEVLLQRIAQRGRPVGAIGPAALAAQVACPRHRHLELHLAAGPGAQDGARDEQEARQLAGVGREPRRRRGGCGDRDLGLGRGGQRPGGPQRLDRGVDGVAQPQQERPVVGRGLRPGAGE